MIDLKEKTAKALYALLKELYQSRAAKEFVDVYEHDRRHRQQADTTDWSYAKSSAYQRLHALCNEPNVWERNQDVICNAARRLAAACNREERRKPEISDVYQDIFGNSYVVIGINDEEPFKKSFVTLIYLNAKAELRSSEVFTVSLEDFLNPTFKKV